MDSGRIPYCITMSFVTVNQSWAVTLNAKRVWNIKGDDKHVYRVGDDIYVPMYAHERALGKLVADGMVDEHGDAIDLHTFRVTQCIGYDMLMQMRNDKQRADLQPESADTNGLFDAKVKAIRRSQRDLAEARASLELLNICLPAAGGFPSCDIQVKRPAHPCDVLVVKLDAAIISHIVMFLREQGLKSDEQRRPYRQEGHGIWKRGNDKFLVPIGEPDETPKKKRKTKLVKGIEAAQEVKQSMSPTDGCIVATDALTEIEADQVVEQSMSSTDGCIVATDAVTEIEADQVVEQSTSSTDRCIVATGAVSDIEADQEVEQSMSSTDECIVATDAVLSDNTASV